MKIFTTTVMFILMMAASCQNGSRNSGAEIEGTDSRLDVNKNDSAGQYEDNNLNPVDSNVYRQKTERDTIFSIDSDLFRVSISTDFDSTKRIIVPKKYVSIYGIDSFEIFESYTKLKIRKNDEAIVDTVLSKNDFSADLDLPLLQYGNLMFPKIILQKTDIQIDHSLSIPMTDIGVSVSSKFKIK